MAFDITQPYALVEAASGWQAFLQGGVFYTRTSPFNVTTQPIYVDPAQSPVVFVNGVLQTLGGTVINTGNLPITTPNPATNRAPFVFSFNQNVLNGFPDPALFIGYNFSAANSGQIVVTEPSWYFGLEGFFFDTVKNTMEAYLAFIPSSGTGGFRPFFWQINRDTNRMSSAQLIGNPLTISDDQGNAAMNIQPSSVIVAPITGADTNFFVRAPTGHAATIELDINGVSMLKFFASATNSVQFFVQTQSNFFWFSTPNGGAGSSMSVGVQDNSAAGVFAASHGSMNTLVAKNFSGSTQDIFICKDGSNNPLLTISSSGTIKPKAYTVATLPSATTVAAGAQSFVTDALAPAFGATVAGSGAINTPVYSDGTNWKVG